MSEYKTQIENLKKGRRFYFRNDPDKVVWTVLDTKRKADHGSKIFIYCEDEKGVIQDYNSNRDVIALQGNDMPQPDEEPVKKKQSTTSFYPPPRKFFQSLLTKYVTYMTHQEAPIKIYYTNDYSIFHMILGNRMLIEPKIKRILKDIADGLDVLKYCPILVKENGDRLDIIDGQHRFYVSKKMKSGVYYIVADAMSLQDIAKINSNTDKWKDSDFINCYAQQGNEHYLKLQEFIDKYQFPIGVSLTMLSKGYMIGEGGATGGTKHKFRSGQFEVKEFDKACELAEQIKLFSVFPGHTTGSFAEAIGRIIKSNKIDLKDLHEKFARDPSQLTSRRNAKEYLTLLETIFNQNNRSRKVIY